MNPNSSKFLDVALSASGVKVDSAGGNLLALCFKIIDRVRIHQN